MDEELQSLKEENYSPLQRHRKAKSIYTKKNNKNNLNNLPKSNKELSKFYNLQKSKSLPMSLNNKKFIDPDALVIDSPFLDPKQKDFVALCNELKNLEVQKRNIYILDNGLEIDLDEKFDFANLQNNWKLSSFDTLYNNSTEILKIVEKVKIPPEERSLSDLLEIVKYLSTTNLGKYFNEGFEQKEIFEKLITFCGVEIKYKFFKKGDIVFRIGDLPDYFYIILLGKVDILKPFPKTILMTGYQFFVYLINLKKSKDEHLFDLSIRANRVNFRVDFDDAKDLHYIYIYIILEQIIRNKEIDFGEELKLVNMSYKDFQLNPEKLDNQSYIKENIKKIKIYLPDISTAIISKYLFFVEKTAPKEVTIYQYSSFLTLETKSHFGDSAMDSNTTRNATIRAAEDTHTAYINCNSYFNNVVVEKVALIDKKVQFLNSNFIFSKIGPKRFEHRYFGLFIDKNYKKGDIIYNEGDKPLNVYFIEQGDVELYTSKNIYELQTVIEYLENKRIKLMRAKDEEFSEEKNYIFTYDKIKCEDTYLRKDIIRKNKKKIFLLKENEDLGILSFYFGYPYFTTSIVSSPTAKIYQIDNKYLSDLILKEKICYNDLINRVEHKLSLFHERFFNINNTKLLLADHQKMLDLKEKKNNNLIRDSSVNNNKNYNYSVGNNNKKNNFNKSILRINYGKIKQIFNKMQNTNINFNSRYKHYHELKGNGKVNNNSQKSTLPLISARKSKRISDNISTDKTYTIKLNTVDKNSDAVNSSNKIDRYSRKTILLKKNIFKNNSEKNINSQRSKINFNLSNIIFRNNSSIFLEEKKFCMDPVLRESYEAYEKMNNSKYKRIQIKKMEYDENEEDQKTRTQSLIYNSSSNNKKKIKKYMNDLKVTFKNANISSKCNSNSYSRNNNIISNYYRDKNVIKKNKATSCKKETILSYFNKDKKEANGKKQLHKNISHPYFTPLVLKKKEQYLILDGDNILKENISQIKKSEKNSKDPLEQLGYFFKFINKLDKNFPFKN